MGRETPDLLRGGSLGRGLVIADALGFPEGRWHGEHTLLMDLERFRAEEMPFLEFTEWLTRTNEEKPATEPTWLNPRIA